jgi:cobalamin biosynthesis protein CobW
MSDEKPPAPKAAHTLTDHGLGLDLAHVHDGEADHDHDDFESFVVSLPELPDPTALVARIASLAEAHKVLRMKGFAAVTGKKMRLLIQAVGPRVSHYYDRAWGEAETRQGNLVVIGLKGLDRDTIAKALLG